MGKRTPLILACTALAALGASPAAHAKRPSHRVSATAELVNRWSYSEPGECRYVGPGTLTVRARTAVSPKATPAIPRSLGRWALVGPYPRNGNFLPPIRSTTTINREDNTTQTPPREGGSCGEPKTGCGVQRAARSTISISGVNRRYVTIEVRTTPISLLRATGTCGSGFVESWFDPVFFGRGAKQRLRVRMPSRRSLRRRRVVKVSANDHEKRRDVDGDRVFTDDVTRRATITFRRR